MSMAAALPNAQFLRDCHGAILDHLIVSGFPLPSSVEQAEDGKEGLNFMIFNIHGHVPDDDLQKKIVAALQNTCCEAKARETHHLRSEIALYQNGQPIGHITIINYSGKVSTTERRSIAIHVCPLEE